MIDLFVFMCLIDGWYLGHDGLVLDSVPSSASVHECIYHTVSIRACDGYLEY
jgi:hypothetical protein